MLSVQVPPPRTQTLGRPPGVWPAQAWGHTFGAKGTEGKCAQVPGPCTRDHVDYVSQGHPASPKVGPFPPVCPDKAVSVLRAVSPCAPPQHPPPPVLTCAGGGSSYRKSDSVPQKEEELSNNKAGHKEQPCLSPVTPGFSADGDPEEGQGNLLQSRGLMGRGGRLVLRDAASGSRGRKRTTEEPGWGRHPQAGLEAEPLTSHW